MTIQKTLPMIEIFRTNVNQEKEAKKILDLLSKKFPDLVMNFDLEDCDKILRVCGCNFTNDEIAEQLQHIGYVCELLED